MFIALKIYAWIASHQSTIIALLGAAHSIDVAVSSSDKMKSNNIYQLIHNSLNGGIKTASLAYRIITGKVLVIPADQPTPEDPDGKFPPV